MENKNISDDNIFSELSKDIKDESIEEIKVKDSAYYIKIIANILWYLNLVLIFVITIIFSYNYIQNSDYKFENELIKNNCSLFLWSKSDSLEECMTITNANKIYNEKIKDLDEKISSKLILVVPKLAKIEKLLFSDNIAFLVRKSETKLKPLEILAEFDRVKNDFIWNTDEDNPDEIICKNIKITDNILEANCNAYSSDRDEWIKWFSWTNKGSITGTSITKAISFLNFIDKNSKKLKNIEKQKIFKLQNSSEKDWLFKKTNFKIKLIYNSSSNL